MSGPLELSIQAVQGCVTQIPSPFSVIGRYRWTQPSGVLRLVDQMLGSWIENALELGIIDMEIGELCFIPGKHWGTPAEVLVLAGMGEPGRFNLDDLTYLMTNVAYAIKSLGANSFCISLIESGRAAIGKRRTIVAMLDGIRNALQRFPGKEPQTLRMRLVVRESDLFEEVCGILAELKESQPVSGLNLTVEAPEKSATAGTCSQRPTPDPGVAPEIPTTRITISRSERRPSDPAARSGTQPTTENDSPGQIAFQYSALSETAVIAVREVVVQSYFASRLPDRVIKGSSRKDQEALGCLLTSYLLPEDFKEMLDDSESLTLVLDSETAPFPWEMAGIRGLNGLRFFGPDLKLTRQFRTSQSPRPATVPALDNHLRILVIADPAPGPLHLDGARNEGFGILKVMQEARDKWRGKLRLEVVARIGARADWSKDDLSRILDSQGLKGPESVVVDYDVCDPLEILTLILPDIFQPFDVIHYAGHGIFDPDSGRKGWVFDRDCIVSACEIFRMRQVPRLVFANACHSSEIEKAVPELAELNQRIAPLIQHAGLAEAFFRKGIRNYIGAGWAVNDAEALQFARVFYRQVLGMQMRRGQLEPVGTAPPATLGESLAHARRVLLDAGDGLNRGSTWGAYQHYGNVNAKLVAFENVDTGDDDPPVHF